MTTVTVVVLAYLVEPWLERCVDSVMASEGVTTDVVVVDNGCTGGASRRLGPRAGVTVIEPGENLGFAGGCNLGARNATGEVLALVNSDAVVAPEALAALAVVALEPGVGIATASIRLADEPERLNSAGNDIHFLGFSWSGKFGQAAAAFDKPRDVLGASGAGLALRRELWEELGGFDDAYFAYHEDAELSIRCWQRGLRVVFVPDAVVIHRYEFSRHATKYELIERNRLLLVLTVMEAKTLVLLAPVAVVAELAMLGLACKDRWWRQKLAGWRWLVRNRRHVARRRRRLQEERLVPDRELVPRLATRIDPANYPVTPALRAFDTVLRRYWRLVSHLA